MCFRNRPKAEMQGNFNVDWDSFLDDPGLDEETSRLYRKEADELEVAKRSTRVGRRRGRGRVRITDGLLRGRGKKTGKKTGKDKEGKKTEKTQKRVQDTQRRISKEIAIEAGNFNLPQNDMERIKGYQDTPEDQEVLEMLVNKYFITYIQDSFRVKSCTAYDLHVAKNHLISNNFVSPKIIEIIDRFIQWKSLSDKNASLLKNTPDKEIIDNITNFFKKIGLEEDWFVTDTFKTKFPEVISKKIIITKIQSV